MEISEDQVVRRVSNEISNSVGAIVEDLLKAREKTREELLVAIEKYNQKIELAARNRQDLDINLAHTISQICLNLLDECWENATDIERRLINMVCCYFLEEEDDEVGDLDSVFGFDDDAQVLNMALESIGREDLVIQI